MASLYFLTFSSSEENTNVITSDTLIQKFPEHFYASTCGFLCISYTNYLDLFTHNSSVECVCAVRRLGLILRHLWVGGESRADAAGSVATTPRLVDRPTGCGMEGRGFLPYGANTLPDKFTM